MKKISHIGKTLIFISFLILFNVNNASACDIDITVVGEEKKTYEIGDELVLHIKVKFTHRICPEGIKKTKFESKGLKILSGTDWKETSPGTWERKLKTKVTETKKGKLFLSVTRTCDKEGGFGSIKLISNS